MSRVLTWVGRLVDALVPCSHRRAMIDLARPGLVRLRCPDCRRVTGGWAVGPAKYRQTQAGDPARHRLVARRPARLVVQAQAIPIFPDIDALADYLASGHSDAAVLMEEPRRTQ